MSWRVGDLVEYNGRRHIVERVADNGITLREPEVLWPLVIVAVSEVRPITLQQDDPDDLWGGY